MYKNTFKNLSKYAVLELVPDLRVLSSLCVSFSQPGRSFLTLAWPRWRLQNTALSSHRKPALLRTLSWRFSLSPPVFPVSVSLIRMESPCPKGYFVIVADAVSCLSLKNQVTVSVSVNCREINSGTSWLIKTKSVSMCCRQ